MDLLNSIPVHYTNRHRYYCVPSIIPENLRWLCNCDLPDKSGSTIYYANKDTIILYMWWKNKPIIKINLTVTEPGEETVFKTNVIISELQADTVTQGTSEGTIGLSQLLNLQGFKISLNS